MDLFSLIVDDDLKPIPPKYEIEGELVHHAHADEIIGYDVFYVTSVVKRHKGLYRMNVYRDGKRITGKTFDREKPIIQESYSLIDAVIMDERMRKYECS